MVGAPGRSKGCKTCRRRKVKCDETKPTCTRCPKAGLACEGYAETPWTITGVGQSGRLTQLNRPQPDAKSPGHASASTSGTQSAEPSVQEIVEARSDFLIPYGDLRLASEAAREHALVCFAAQKVLPWPFYGARVGASGRSVYTSPTRATRSWIYDSLEMGPAHAFHPAVCCLSACFIARESQKRIGMSSSDLTVSAIHYYRLALNNLSSILRDEDGWKNPGTLGVVYVLSIYELINVRGGDGWMRHAGGIGSLVRALGPSAFLNEPGSSFLNLSRLSIVALAVEQRKKCFLVAPEWYSRGIYPDDSDYLHCILMDVFATIPGVLEDADALEYVEDEARALDHTERLRRTVIETVVALFQWRMDFENSVQHNARVVPVDPKKSITLNTEGEPLFSSILVYEDLGSSRSVVMYDVLLLVLIQLGQDLDMHDIAAEAFDTFANSGKFVHGLSMKHYSELNSVLHLPSRELTAAAILTEVCRSVEFHLLKGSIYTGALMLLYPFRMLCKIITNIEIEAWLRRVSDILSEQHGLACFAEIWDDWS